MFTLAENKLNHTCAGHSRREFLKVGSLGMLGGLTLPHLLEVKALAAKAGHVVKDKSVVFLFLNGGPSHIEMFDPKMTAPDNYRSITGEVMTSIPGITYGGTFPQLGKLAHKLAVVRSYASGNGGHTYLSTASGGNPLKAAMGAVYSRVAGSMNAASGIPNNIVILPEAVQAGLKLKSNFETKALPTLTDTGSLGPNYSAFNPSGAGQLKQNMVLSIPRERFDERRTLLAGLDSFKRQVDKTGVLATTDQYQQQAFDVITRGVADAFDLTKEDPRTIERYDTSKLFTLAEVNRWGDMRRSSNLLGKQMLMARRLCEAGCGFITVSDCGWDMHSNGNSPKKLAGMNWLGPQVDHAVSAFLEDIEDRGLSDKILLVITGEMGRSPKINKNGGRDHYGNLTSLVFAGGGLNMGQVIGQSDRNAARPASTPYAPKHMMATIMHTLLDIPELRLQTNLGRVVDVLTADEPIAGLM